MAENRTARAMGVNHVALEVGDIEEALAFYGRLFEFKLRGKSKNMAFIDLGDQFIALQKGRKQPPDDGRHFGLVVDDKEAARRALKAAGVETLPGPFLDFLDPWGNRVEIVGYDNIQFTKAPNVLRGMGLSHLTKKRERAKGAGRKGHGTQSGRLVAARTLTNTKIDDALSDQFNHSARRSAYRPIRQTRCCCNELVPKARARPSRDPVNGSLPLDSFRAGRMPVTEE